LAETTGRLLALLGLLQTRPSWTGPELAERLGVTTRTIRNDVERLRGLDYPVEAARGSIGGYRLGAGTRLPPLVLDDEEAVAVAVGLRTTATLTGSEDAGRRALAKLEQVLPSRLRPVVDAVAHAVDRAPENTGTDAPDPVVDPTTLSTIATAIRGQELLRFDYSPGTTGDDNPPPRLVEPYRLLAWQRRWYLVGRDPASDAWDVFRADHLVPRMRTGRRFTPHPVPGGDFAAFAMRQAAMSGWAVHARLRIAAPAATVISRINPAVGVVEAVSDNECVLVTGADSLATIAAYAGMLGLDFTVETPAELRDHLLIIARRYLSACSES
jgi:predicted DNA-binding transcriptional regulator YafY